MNRSEIFATIKKTVGSCIPGMDVSVLTEDTILAETEIESMGFMLIICRLEALYNITIPENLWAKLTTVNDVITAIEERV